MTFNYANAKEMADAVKEEIGKVVIGNEEVIDLMITAIVARGHVLLEGVPGVGKTLMVRAAAQSLNSKFSRIQFTPDMMPADITGTNIFNMKTQDFTVKKGPLFSDILLADEINRTPPKTQSALLQAMEERKVTIDDRDYDLGELFTVFATQNPIEYEGTYPLPEAQLDRFMFKIDINYPEREASLKMLHMFNEYGYVSESGNNGKNVLQSADEEAIKNAREEALNVRVEPQVLEYIQNIIDETRKHSAVRLGASPRAAISLLMAAKAFACIYGSDYVTPDDIKYLAPFVLTHRILLNPEDEIEGLSAKSVIDSVLLKVKVPR